MAVPVRDDNSRPTWIPWVIALLIALLVGVVLWAVFAGDDEEEPLASEDVAVEPVEEEPLEDEPLDEEPLDEGPVGEEPLDEEPLDEPAADEPADDAPVDEEPLVLAVPFPDLASEEGRQVTASGIDVVDVPADEGFTVGTADDELFIYITEEARAAGPPESATNVEPGSVLTSLEGTVEPVTDEFLSQLQLEGDEADALRERGFYIAATSFEIASS